MDFENLNNKKLIFIITGFVLVILIWVMFLTLWSSSKNTKSSKSWDLTIWSVWDNKDKLYNFVQDFKKDTKRKSLVINVENFDSWEDYDLALSSAIISWKAPDIFVLPSWEKSFLDNQILALDPTKFDADTFRKDYKEFIWNKLIDSVVVDKKTQKKKDFVLWIPIWYETLWIYYNRFKGIQASDFKSWAALNKRIQVLKDRNPSIIPLWFWRGKTVLHSWDIITQFLMLEWITSVNNADEAKIKSAFSTYFMYADSKVNWYDQKDDFMKIQNKNNFDLFSRWDIAMLAWFPRDLYRIDKNGFRKPWLYAQPFPGYFDWSWKSFAKFKYFVVNKDTKNLSDAMWFMEYINSDSWASKYLKTFPYYLPAKISLEQDFLDSKIIDWYNIKLKDFDNQNLEKSTFDKKVKSFYDKDIVNVLDEKNGYINSFMHLKTQLICDFKKIVLLENLSWNCNK